MLDNWKSQRLTLSITVCPILSLIGLTLINVILHNDYFFHSLIRFTLMNYFLINYFTAEQNFTIAQYIGGLDYLIFIFIMAQFLLHDAFADADGGGIEIFDTTSAGKILNIYYFANMMTIRLVRKDLVHCIKNGPFKNFLFAMVMATLFDNVQHNIFFILTLIKYIYSIGQVYHI